MSFHGRCHKAGRLLIALGAFRGYNKTRYQLTAFGADRVLPRGKQRDCGRRILK